jgi:hypothetical protein
MGRNFDGTGDFITVTRTATLNTLIDGSYTVTMWLRSSSTTAVKRTWGLYDSTSGINTVLFNHSSLGKLIYYAGSGNDVDSLLSTASGLNDGVWRHYAFQKDGTTIRIYIDAVLDNSRTRVAATTTDADLFIGGSNGDPGALGFEGDLAEFRMFNAILTASEIASVRLGKSVREAVTKVDLPILGNASPEPDWSGNGHNSVSITNTTQADHPPIAPRWGFDEAELIIPAAAARKRRAGIGTAFATRI